MHSFTPEDLVQYLYKETSQEETALLKAALQTDWSLREDFEVISAAIHGLEKLTLSPRNVSVDNIIRYAEKSLTELPTNV